MNNSKTPGLQLSLFSSMYSSRAEITVASPSVAVQITV